MATVVQLIGNAFHSGIFGRGERLERAKGSQIVGQLLLGAHAGQDNMHIVVAAHPAQRPGTPSGKVGHLLIAIDTDAMQKPFSVTAPSVKMV